MRGDPKPRKRPKGFTEGGEVRGEAEGREKLENMARYEKKAQKVQKDISKANCEQNQNNEICAKIKK